MRDLLLRLRALFFRQRAEQELDDEVGFHLEMEARKNRAAGSDDAEARRLARARFGPTALVKDNCRDQRRINLIETLWQDLRYAIRGFRRSPGFALTVIATIALGLGINIAVFTIFDSYVLRPFAVRDPYSLYEFFWLTHSGKKSLNAQEYQELRRQNLPFSEVYATRGLQTRLEGRVAFGELVSGNYFRALGVGTALGRGLTAEDDAAPGREAVVVLSYRTWQNVFGGDLQILGRKILIHGYPLEVVGVGHDGFDGVSEIPRDFWAPLSMSGQLDPDGAARLQLFGRLKKSLSVSQAQAALQVAAVGWNEHVADNLKATGAEVRSRATNVHISPRALLVLAPIVSVFGLVLLIACANVANMMLARAMARQREIGIRLSLGAARGRIIRQLLTESVLLALPAAMIGLGISQAAISGGIRLLFATVPSEYADFLRIVPLTPDLRVFAFMMAAAMVAAILFGLAPAIQATRASVVEAARGDFTNKYRPARLRNALVIAQIAGCSALLISSGVLLRGANRIGKLETGMRTRDVLDIEVQEKARQMVLAQLAADPLVEMVGASAEVPLDSGFPSFLVPAGDGRMMAASYDFVSPEFFNVFEIPILRGRNFSAGEASSGAAVTLVSETMARRLWPNEDAAGKAVEFSADPRSHKAGPLSLRSARVIGVVGDIVTGVVDDATQRSSFYLPTLAAANGTALVVRVRGDVEAARLKLDKSLSAAAPGGVQQIHKMQQLVEGRSYPFRAAYWVSAVVGGLALVLTVTGIYGVLSYLVSQRTKEIGVRVAMGASSGKIVALVVTQSLRLAMIGLGIAIALALAMSRLLASQLEMMNTFDLVGYSAAISLVLAACAVAAFFPSMRAAKIDPLTALRHE